jgi:rubrerythrin
MELGSVQVCSVCGYTIEGEAPETCPLCKAKREMFDTYS